MAGPLFLRSTSTFSTPTTTTWTRKRIMKTTIGFLFLLNSLYLFTYFLHHHDNNPHQQRLIHHHPLHHPLSLSSTSSSSNPNSNKPWPILPSYLPWSPPSVTPLSCEGYFGNGFSQLADVIPRPRSQSQSGWLRCYFNPTLRSSVCEAGRVRMDPNKIRMSKGGESIEEVIGRLDEEELPSFDFGAFQIQEKKINKKIIFPKKNNKDSKRVVSEEILEKYVPEGQIMKHTMRELFGSMELVNEEFHCDEWIEEPTLLLTRFEYANVFHTYTDWYSSYVSSRVTGLPTRPNVVFVDGHSKTQLEETWEALFSSVRFAKNFTGPVCFRHAIFVPLGYETAWFKGLSETIDCQGTSSQDLWANPDDRKTARLSEFGEMIKAAFDFPVERHKSPRPTSEYNVLFVRREDYLAHPRNGGKVESRLGNEQEVFDALKSWVVNHTQCRVNLINGLFAHMGMREQIRAIQDANVIIGAHGAGLTHVVAATPKTVILEIISSQFRRPHFQLISQWRGLDYHAINLPGNEADPKEVIERFERILKSIGC